MAHALARPHPPAGLAHVLALPVRPANEPNGPPRSLRPAGPALLASAHPALALGEWIRCRTRGIYSFSCLRITSLLRLNHLALLLHPVEDTANS